MGGRALFASVVTGAVIVSVVLGSSTVAGEASGPTICVETNQRFDVSHVYVDQVFYDAEQDLMTVSFVSGGEVTLPLQCGDSYSEPRGVKSKTECSTLGSVCVTAIAGAFVQCEKRGGFDYCKGSGVVGGHGASPVQFPGEMDYEGRSKCTADCPDADNWKWAFGGPCSWPGLTGYDGCGSAKDIPHPAAIHVMNCIGDYDVYTDDWADARSYVPLTTHVYERIGTSLGAQAHGGTC